jgi:hypothetical protein
MSNEPNAEVLSKLAVASNQRNKGVKPAVTPPAIQRPKQPTINENSPVSQAPAGSATATYLLVDHYFGASAGTFWAYSGSQWFGASTGEPADEQGISQVAFASNRVDMNWDDNNALTLIRCWKYL